MDAAEQQGESSPATGSTDQSEPTADAGPPGERPAAGDGDPQNPDDQSSAGEGQRASAAAKTDSSSDAGVVQDA